MCQTFWDDTIVVFDAEMPMPSAVSLIWRILWWDGSSSVHCDLITFHANDPARYHKHRTLGWIHVCFAIDWSESTRLIMSTSSTHWRGQEQWSSFALAYKQAIDTLSIRSITWNCGSSYILKTVQDALGLLDQIPSCQQDIQFIDYVKSNLIASLLHDGSNPWILFPSESRVTVDVPKHTRCSESFWIWLRHANKTFHYISHVNTMRVIALFAWNQSMDTVSIGIMFASGRCDEFKCTRCPKPCVDQNLCRRRIWCHDRKRHFRRVPLLMFGQTKKCCTFLLESRRSVLWISCPYDFRHELDHWQKLQILALLLSKQWE